VNLASGSGGIGRWDIEESSAIALKNHAAKSQSPWPMSAQSVTTITKISTPAM
jgi:hypothetical protein